MTKTTAQRITFGVAIACYLGAIGCGIGAAMVHAKTVNDSLRGALIAAAIYLLFCGGAVHLAKKVILRERS